MDVAAVQKILPSLPHIPPLLLPPSSRMDTLLPSLKPSINVLMCVYNGMTVLNMFQVCI